MTDNATDDKSSEKASVTSSSDELRIRQVKQLLKKCQIGAVVSLCLLVGLMAFSVMALLGGERAGLFPLEELPNNRANHLLEISKKAVKNSRKASEEIPELITGDKAVSVLADARKVAELMIGSENQYYESLNSYGETMEAATLVIGGAKEWNHGFQKELASLSRRSQQRLEKLNAVLLEYPVSHGQ